MGTGVFPHLSQEGGDSQALKPLRGEGKWKNRKISIEAKAGSLESSMKLINP